MCRLAVRGDETGSTCRIWRSAGRDRRTRSIPLRSCTLPMPDSELFLILGGDIAAGLPGWHEPERVLSLATVAVAERPGTPHDAVADALRSIPGAEHGRVLRHAGDRDLLDDAPGAGSRRRADPLSGARRGSRLHRPAPAIQGQPRGMTPEQIAGAMTPEEIATAIAHYASDRKALEIVQLDLRGMIGYTDYFVICTGRTDRQTKAIHDAIHAGHEVRARTAAASGRGASRGALDPDGLPRRGRPRVHARDRASTTGSSSCGARRLRRGPRSAPAPADGPLKCPRRLRPGQGPVDDWNVAAIGGTVCTALGAPRRTRLSLHPPHRAHSPEEERPCRQHRRSCPPRSRRARLPVSPTAWRESSCPSLHMSARR